MGKSPAVIMGSIYPEESPPTYRRTLEYITPLYDALHIFFFVPVVLQLYRASFQLLSASSSSHLLAKRDGGSREEPRKVDARLSELSVPGIIL